MCPDENKKNNIRNIHEMYFFRAINEKIQEFNK